MNIAKHGGTIFLVGFMGTGKTTIGRLLAGRLAREFVDLDEAVEEAAGMPVARIFAERGEPSFRSLESSVLAGLAAPPSGLARESGEPGRVNHAADGTGGENAGRDPDAPGLVLACGGGTFCVPENEALMKREGVAVWLNQPFDQIWRRGNDLAGPRPLFGSEAELRALYDQRAPMYARADVRIDVEEGRIDRAVDEIVLALQKSDLID